MGNCQKLAESLFFYETPKIVQIKSKVVGVISRIIQLTILTYIIGYVLVYKKGYQEFSEVESSVTTKVKGVAFTDFPNEDFREEILHPEWYRRIWDVADFVVPPSENGATFIATNVIITQNQIQGFCAEDPKVTGAICTKESNTCIAGKATIAGNGVMTGRCIKREMTNLTTCEIRAWCPTEDDILPLKNGTALLESSENFTVLIKNFVDFPLFEDSHRRNIKDTSNETYLKNCLFDPVEFLDCPIFRLGDIVKWSGSEDYNAAAANGSVIAVVINWDCDLDYDKKYCFPKYDFIRLDDPKAKLAPGWNFRYANYFGDNSRTLYKMYGIRLSISVVGQAGKFRIIPLLQNLGAGLGLLALEVVICDIVVLYIVRKHLFYQSKKYEKVIEDWEAMPEVVVTNQEEILPKDCAEDKHHLLDD